MKYSVLFFLVLFSPSNSASTSKAIFAGGCFWCMEKPFEILPGVVSAVSGYTGGHKKNPTYQQVSAGTTGHTEAVEITYDADKISYQQLIDVFWKNIDPLAKDRQFCDKGTQYRSGVFYLNAQQHHIALASKAKIKKVLKGQPIATEITKAAKFYPAEAYHQDFYKKSKARYTFYRYSCGRDKRLQALWGKPKH